MTQSHLKKHYKYNRNTGIFTRSHSTTRPDTIGRKVGSIGNHGYLVINYKNKPILLHQLAYLWEYGFIPNEIDHINRIRTDNRICNLRSVTRTQNMRNMSISKRNNSGTKGVSWDKSRNKWKAEIGLNSRTKFVGRYNTLEDAIIARKNAEVEYGYRI